MVSPLVVSHEDRATKAFSVTRHGGGHFVGNVDAEPLTLSSLAMLLPRSVFRPDAGGAMEGTYWASHEVPLSALEVLGAGGVCRESR
jgi:hypothetical protein